MGGPPIAANAGHSIYGIDHSIPVRSIRNGELRVGLQPTFAEIDAFVFVLFIDTDTDCHFDGKPDD